MDIPPENPRSWLDTHAASAATSAAALDYFDSLHAATVPDMLGRWRGSGLPTAHPMDGLLEAFGWWGKAFHDPDRVDPLLFGSKSGAVTAVDSRFVPAALLPRLRMDSPLMPLLRAIFPAARAVLATKKPTARLRMMEHRGVVSATMIYDFLPINDVFRRVDQDTRLGLMDLRGMAQPFFFVLKRA
jgi:hypothetical protein